MKMRFLYFPLDGGPGVLGSFQLHDVLGSRPSGVSVHLPQPCDARAEGWGGVPLRGLAPGAVPCLRSYAA